MKTLEFKDYVHLSEYIYELVEEQKHKVSVIMLKNGVNALLKELINYDVFTYGQIKLSEYDNHYNKEYYLIINTDFTIDVTPVYDADNITLAQSKIILYEDMINLQLISLNDSCIQYEIFIRNKNKCICDNCCYDCNSCPRIDD